MLAGVSVLLGWMLFGPEGVMHEVFPGLVTSCLVYVVFALVGRPAVERLPG
jgi:hypothetical protein